MNSKKRIGLIVAAICVLTFVFVGVTYSYWIVTKKQNGMNRIIAACLDFELTNADPDNTSINLEDAMPITVDEAVSSTENNYSFKVTNNCNEDVSFYVALENLTTSNQIDGDSLIVSLDNKIFSTFNDLKDTTPMDSNASEAKLLKYDTLEGKEDRTYSLGMFINRTSSLDDVGKSFSSKIFVTGGQVGEDDTFESYKLTDDSCFTITEDGVITGYDVGCGSEVVVPAMINGIKVKEIATNAFRTSDITYSGGGSLAKIAINLDESTGSYNYNFYVPNDDNPKLKYMLERAMENEFSNMFLPLKYEKKSNGFQTTSYFDSKTEDLIPLYINGSSFSVIELDGHYYIIGKTFQDALKVNESKINLYDSYLEYEYTANDKLYVYEDNQSYEDFSASLWGNMEQNSSASSATSLYFVSNNMTFEQFKSNVSSINSNIDLSALSVTSINTEQAKSLLTDDYNNIIGLKLGKLYHGSYQYMSYETLDSMGLMTMVGNFKYVTRQDFSGLVEDISSDSGNGFLGVVESFDIGFTSFEYNLNNEIYGYTFNEDDVDAYLYENKSDEYDYLVVLNNTKIDKNLINMGSNGNGKTYTVIYESEFTDEMKQQYVWHADSYGRLGACIDDEKVMTDYSVSVDKLDLSNAVFLNIIDPYAFSNVQNAKEDYVMQEVKKDGITTTTYNIDGFVGLTSLKLPRLATNILLAPGAFSGLKTDELILYNNVQNGYDYLLSGGDLDRLDEAAKMFNSDSICPGSDYACGTTPFEFSIIKKLIIKDADGSHISGHDYYIDSSVDPNVLYDGNKMLSTTDSSMGNILLWIVSVVGDFYNCKIDNLYYDKSISRVGLGVISLCDIDNIYFSKNIVALNSLAVSIWRDDNYDGGYNVFLEETASEFKNRVSLYTTVPGSTPGPWTGDGSVPYFTQQIGN